MDFAPIVLFVYNRLEHAQRTIDALKKNMLAASSDLYIYSDGAKDNSDRLKVDEVRHFIRQVKGFKRVVILERDHNWGLADNLIDAVTRLVNQYGRIIVLEDDDLPSPYFLNYMNDALEFFKDKSKVMHITGYMFPVNTEGLKDAFCLYPTTSWGWGTWSRAWKYFDKNPGELLKKFDPKMIKEFNLDDSYPDYWAQVKSNAQGIKNTWSVFWYASVFLNRGLSLHPKHSLIKNIGHDDSGINCPTTHIYDTQFSNQYAIDFSRVDLSLDAQANDRLKAYFQSIQPVVPDLMTRVSNKIRKILHYG